MTGPGTGLVTYAIRHGLEVLGDAGYDEDIRRAALAELDDLEADIQGYRRALVAHHDIATLSDDVLREYDYRECPVCARARA